MVAAMDAVGVNVAIIVSTFNLYRYDPSYALEVYRKYPDRFRVVKPIDVTDPAIDDVCADWAKTEGAVGVGIMLKMNWCQIQPMHASSLRGRRQA
jgi:hypothetical protein